MLSQQYSARLAEIEELLLAAVPDRVDPLWIGQACGHLGVTPDADSFAAILQPARDLLLRGGKRWRPLLCLAACELSGGGARALPLAVLVELAHNGSLIVDDIEDHAEWRRGAASIHVLYGEDTAINSANFLYFLPTLLIESAQFRPEEKAVFYRMYMEDMRRLHVGQGLDIRWHRDHTVRPHRDEYLQMCRLKTGSLARLAARMGHVAGGGDPQRAEQLGAIFEDAGVAFQILDDVRNLTSGNPGKHRGDDIVEGKKSLPVILSGDIDPKLSEQLAACFDRAHAEGPSSPSVEEAIGLMDACGSIAKSSTIASSMLDRATEQVTAMFEESESRSLLIDMLGGFTA